MQDLSAQHVVGVDDLPARTEGHDVILPEVDAQTPTGTQAQEIDASLHSAGDVVSHDATVDATPSIEALPLKHGGEGKKVAGPSSLQK